MKRVSRGNPSSSRRFRGRSVGRFHHVGRFRRWWNERRRCNLDQTTCHCGVRQTTTFSRNPPPPACPADPPQHGASCVYTCTWGSCGDPTAAFVGTCNGKLWSVDDQRPPPADAGAE